MSRRHSVQPENRSLSVLLPCTVIALAVLLLYAPARNFDFVVMDDPIYVQQNPLLRDGLGVGGIVEALRSSHGSTWIPLTWISLMVDRTLFGLQPGPFHVVNVLLHAVNAVLLFLLLRRFAISTLLALLLSLLFALHPLRVESVAWITERKDVLSSLFWFLALHAYLLYTRRASARRMAMVVLCMLLGGMAKATLVTLPAILLLLDRWPLGRWSARGWRPLLLEKLPLLAISIGVASLALWAQAAGGRVEASMALGTRLARGLIGYAHGVQKFFLPTELSALYPDIAPIAASSIALAALLLVALGALCWRLRVAAPAMAFGWTFYLVTALPTAGFLRVGVAHLADRFSYLPSIGLSICLAGAVAALVTRGRLPRRAALGALALCVMACAVLTRNQLLTWRDSETLFRHALRHDPQNPHALNYLGGYLGQQGKFDDAVPLLRSAVQLSPDFASARGNLGSALLMRNEVDAAIEQLQQAVRLDPRESTAQIMLGSALIVAGRLAEAEPVCTRALAQAPGQWQAHFHMGLLREVTGRRSEAAAHYRNALALSPQNAQVLARLRGLGG